MVATKRRKQDAIASPATLGEYLALPYRLEIIGDGSGSYLVRYPELPGCFTQIDDLADAQAVAREILTTWLELALEDGEPIPLPAPQQFGGRVLVRMPKSLHRWLVETAAEEDVSLNTRIVSLLAAGSATHELRCRLDEVSTKIDALRDQQAQRQASAIRSVS